MQQTIRKKVAAAAVATALAAGGLAVASHQAPTAQAATATTTTTATASAAKAAGPAGEIKVVLDQLVGQNKLSSAQETDVLTAWQQYQQQHPHGNRGVGRGAVGGEAPAIATALKLTPQQLQQQLQSGKSIAAIAQAQKVPLQTVKDAITAAAKTRLDAAVAAGRITSAQETQQLSNLASSLDQRLNAIPGQFRGHGTEGAEAPETSEAPAGA